jgi:hypothetical protein
MIDDSHRQAEDEQEEKLERRPRVQLRKLAWPKFNSPIAGENRVLLYCRLTSVANGATASGTEALARRGGILPDGTGGRCSRVPISGASSTPMPIDTKRFSSHMDSTSRC